MLRAFLYSLSFVAILMTAAADSLAFESDLPFVKGEILVVNPSTTFSAYVQKQGFNIIENLKMEELDMEVSRLSIPANMNVPTAIQMLSERYPDMDIGANQVFNVTTD